MANFVPLLGIVNGVIKKADVENDHASYNRAKKQEELVNAVVLTNSTLEVANGSTSSLLELDDVDTGVESLRIANHLHGHLVVLHQLLYFAQLRPQVIRIEDAKLAHTGELINMLRRDLLQDEGKRIRRLKLELS